MQRSYRVAAGKHSQSVTLAAGDDDTVVIDGGDGPRRYTVRPIRAGILLMIRDDGAALEVAYYCDGDAVNVEVGGATFRFTVLDEMQAVLREKRGGAGSGDGELRVAMPGRVVAVMVRAGDLVEAGQGVVIVEAMKMENELKAPASGVVDAVRVEPGKVVEAGELLLKIAVANPD